MIVVDASAIVAILRLEPEAERFIELINAADVALISAPTRLEVFISRWRRAGPDAAREAVALMAEFGLTTVQFDEVQLEVAMKGFAEHGRRRGKANLNYGDCFSYALAKSRRLPLLFKGDDFIHTDVEPVV